MMGKGRDNRPGQKAASRAELEERVRVLEADAKEALVHKRADMETITNLRMALHTVTKERDEADDLLECSEQNLTQALDRVDVLRDEQLRANQENERALLHRKSLLAALLAAQEALGNTNTSMQVLREYTIQLEHTQRILRLELLGLHAELEDLRARRPTPSATTRLTKQGWRLLARMVHPDRHPEERKEDANEAMRLVREMRPAD